MDQEVKKFENEGYFADAVAESGCRQNVRVTFKSKTAQKAYQKAVKQVNKQISIPGFRKGHAPDRAVISRYSSYIEKEWKEILIEDAYRTALDLTKIYPMNRESIDRPKIETYSQEEAVVSIAYDHYPQLPTIDFAKIRLPEIVIEKVDDKKIDEMIDEIRKAHADWEDVPARSVEKGDFVDLTIYSLEEDPPRLLFDDRRFEVAEKHLAPWLMKLLIGMKPEETVEATSEVDESSEERVKQNFKPTKVRIILNRIKKIVPPPIDDQLAQKTGALSLDDLKSKIQTKLEKESEENLRRKQIMALEEALLKAYHFDLPRSLVEAERAERIARKIQALKNANVSDEEIKSQQAAIEKEVAFDLDQALRLYFLNKQIIRQGNISLSNEELNAEVMHHMNQNPNLYESGNTEEQTREFVSKIASAMLQNKAKNYALNQILVESAQD